MKTWFLSVSVILTRLSPDRPPVQERASNQGGGFFLSGEELDKAPPGGVQIGMAPEGDIP
jgi:hypothetical protein